VATELLVREKDGKTHRVRVPDEGLTIGRKPPPFGASYCTPNSAVSRLHCRLTRLGDSWYVEDLGSANGTNVNGEAAKQPTKIKAGDMIVLGPREEGIQAQVLINAPPPIPKPLETLDEEMTQVAGGGPIDKIRTSYDTVADKYASELADDMIARPLERGMFLAFAELVQAMGPGVIGDIGCGPGHVTEHLTSLGMQVIGIDVSPEMIEQARKRFPTGDFRIGSMFDLPVLTSAWTGAVSIYATLHSNADERAQTFRELWRVIKPGGYVLHGFYISAPDQPPGSVYHLANWFGRDVDLDAYFISLDDGTAELERGGFDVMASLVREPLNTKELPARRCYMIAKRR
jgi:ubiquinone/menaquinone biosynthesis C-methylase UbiE